MQLPEIAEKMLTYATQHDGRVSCCAAGRAAKRDVRGPKTLGQSQQSVLRFLCSDAIAPILSRLGLDGHSIVFRHSGLGEHKCPCESSECSLPLQSFHGVWLYLVRQ